MRSASSTVNEPADLESDVRGGSLAPAVTRAAAILDLLAERPASDTALSDLARGLGLPKSSVANICGALVEAGLARRSGSGFRLGRRLAELGGAYLAAVDQIQEFYELADPSKPFGPARSSPISCLSPPRRRPRWRCSTASR